MRTPFDANLSPPLSFENSQQRPREPYNQIKRPRLVKIIPPTSPLDATSSQYSNFYQPTLRSCLRRQPVKDYRTNAPLLFFQELNLTLILLNVPHKVPLRSITHVQNYLTQLLFDFQALIYQQTTISLRRSPS